MSTDFEKLEAMQKRTYFEKKLEMIPTSIKEIYSAISGKDVLVARELIINDRVFMGIEYAPDGKPVSAYTTNKTGKRIVLEHTDNKSSTPSYTPKDLISERLNKLAHTFAHQSETSERLTTEEPRKTVCKTAPDIKTLNNFKNKKHQKA